MLHLGYVYKLTSYRRKRKLYVDRRLQERKQALDFEQKLHSNCRWMWAHTLKDN